MTRLGSVGEALKERVGSPHSEAGEVELSALGAEKELCCFQVVCCSESEQGPERSFGSEGSTKVFCGLSHWARHGTGLLKRGVA